jgi:hypothetical protein
MPRNLLHFIIVGLGFLIGGGETALADPPDRVGRVAFLSGTVSLHQPDENGWIVAEVNYPVIAGSKLSTESEARAEIDLGGYALRLDGSTELALTRLNSQEAFAALYNGRLALHLTTTANAELVRIVTSRGVLELKSAGDYQIDAGDDTAPTQMTIVDGQAELSMGTMTVKLTTGQTIVIRGDRPGDYTIEPARDVADNDWSWDWRWDWRSLHVGPVADNDEDLPPILAGSMIFASSGTWQKWPDGKHVWIPKGVPAGWKPYHDGHWAWVGPWGWTWIDKHPWGFLPSHYGRWVQHGDVWGWVPGPLRLHDGWDHHPVYAPALVTFPRTPAGDHPAWTPLGPEERYHPPYAGSAAYTARINRDAMRDAEPPAEHDAVRPRTVGSSQFVHETQVVNPASELNPVPRTLIMPSASSIAPGTSYAWASAARPSERARSVELPARPVERAPIEAVRPKIEAPNRSEPAARSESADEKQKSSKDDRRSNR